jgi:protein-tyrosine phosphatase
MTAAYCQSSKWLTYDEDMSLTYAFVIGTTNQQIPYGDDHILRARSEEFDWYRMTYRPVTLPAGEHLITMSVISNTQTGCPCTDYLEFLIEEPGSNPDIPPVVDEVPENDFHTLVQYQYINDPDWHNIKNYAQGTTELSIPRALQLKFDDLGDASKYYIQVSKGDNDFTGEVVRETTVKYYELWNSELGETYYYKAATSEAGLSSASVKQLTVATQAPRNLSVGGISNFRDVGGWKSSLIKNGVVKQGLYYRCAQFNSIKTAGKAELKRLGIKLDIDMRDRPPSSSPASSSDWKIEIMDARVASGTESSRWEGTGGIAATYKKIFEAIANADQKPIALHCTHGADRTGITSFFLLGLLGVNEDDIGRDYVLTRFAGERAVLPLDDSTGTSEIAKWFTKTNALEGATFADKMYKHLKDDFGIAADTLETIREKFVPGYTRPAGA